MHITGGAFTKLKDVLGRADAIISFPKKLKPQKIFQEMRNRGLSNKIMYSTFNCGVGFVLSASAKETPKILGHLKNGAIIGEITAGTGEITIKSAFDGEMVKL